MKKTNLLILMTLHSFFLLGQEDTPCEIGNEFFQNYAYQQAILEFEKCLELDPENVKMLWMIANSNFQLGQFEEAKKHNSLIIDLDSLNRKAHLQLSKIYTQEGKIDLAVQQYEKLIQLDSNNSFFRKNYASLLTQSGRFQEGIIQYKRCLELNPKDIRSAISLSKIYYDLEQNDLSLSILNESIENSNSHILLFTELGKVHYKMKNFQEAIKSIENKFELGADTSLLDLKILGVSYFQLAQYQKSIFLLQKADKQSDSNESMNYYLGSCYLELNQLEKSEEHLQKSIKQGISNNLDNFYTNLAIVYEKKKDYKSSISAFKLAYQYSKNKILLYHLARNYDVYYKDKTTAIRYYKKYIEQNDTNNASFMDYSEHRLSELKSVKHFDLDTIN